MKKVLVLILAVTMLFTLCACSGDTNDAAAENGTATDSGIVGTWKITDEYIALLSDSMGSDNELLDILIEDFKNITYEFTDDGKVIGRLPGEPGGEGTYTIDGETITMAIDGNSVPMTLDGDTLLTEGVSYLERV